MACICCSGGTTTCKIPTCLTTLNLGTTTVPEGTGIWVFIRNHDTKQVQRVTATVDINLEIPAPVFLMPEGFLNAYNRFNLYAVTHDDPNVAIAIIPEGTIYSSTCFDLQFQEEWEGSDLINYSGLVIDLRV